jgi:hypothetical protein
MERKMADDEDRELAEEIHLRVWEATTDPNEIIEIMSDDPDLSEEETEWIRAEVMRVHAAKREAEKSWPAVTDVDKLAAAFAALDAAGIIALHHAGFEMSDGLHDVGEEYRARGGEGSGVVGYCFYHGQDVHRAIMGQGLMLAFGDMTDDAAKSEAIGRRIVDEIERAGFRVTWNGKKAQRIQVNDLRWQKRGP